MTGRRGEGSATAGLPDTGTPWSAGWQAIQKQQRHESEL